MSPTKRMSPELRVLLSNTLRCHGMEKNLQAISLCTPEYQHHLLQTTPNIMSLMPKDAQDYARGAFNTDYDRFDLLTSKICQKNAGNPNAITQEELREQIALREKIGSKLNVAIIGAVLRDSGLVSADDLAKGYVRVSKQGVVEVDTGFTPSAAQRNAAREYIASHQPERQPDGRWTSQAHIRSEAGGRAAQ